MAFAPIGEIEVVDPSTVVLSGYATITGVQFTYFDPYEFRLRRMQFDRGAFTNWLDRNNGAPLPVHWSHGLDNFQIAETTDLVEDDRGLRFESTPIASSVGIDALTVIAGRRRTGASLVFDFGDTVEDSDGVEHIVDVVDVIELGPTPRGVNPHAFAVLIDRAAEENQPAPATEAQISTDTGAALAAEIYRAIAHIRSL